METPLKPFTTEHAPGPCAVIGLARAGKDYSLERGGFVATAVSSPLTSLFHRWSGFGHIDRAAPGYRRVLQTWGQWGRGWVTEAYPWTTERVAWLDRIRRDEHEWLDDHKLDDAFLGRPEFWAMGAVGRILRRSVADVTSRRSAAISGIRFESDIAAIPEEWPIYLVVSPMKELMDRMIALGESPAIHNDESERLALDLTMPLLSDSATPVPQFRERITGVIWNGPPDGAELALARRRASWIENSERPLKWYLTA